MVNIGLVIIALPRGGRETVVNILQDYFSKKGNNVTVIANDEFFEWDEPMNCNHIKLGSLNNIDFVISDVLGSSSIPVFFKSNLFVPLWRDLYFEKNRDIILSKIKDKKIEILNFHDQGGLLLCRNNSLQNIIPCIYTSHGDPYDFIRSEVGGGRGLINGFYKGYQKRGLIGIKSILKAMSTVTAVSSFQKDKWISQGFPKEINVINNGFSLPIDLKKSIGTNSNSKFRIIYPGGEVPHKGGDVLLKAVRLLRKAIPNIEVIITREVSPSSPLKEYVKLNKLEKIVRFVGQLNRNEHMELLASCDLLVQPSAHEAFSLVLLEGMALGKPIIATGTTGTNEIILHGRNGLLTSPRRRPSEIAAMVKYFYSNPNFYQLISRNNLKDINSLTWEKIADDYISLYQKILLRKENG